MKHPKREEWVPYLYGEVDPETQRQLRNHLRECAACRTAVRSWRQTMSHLDQWRLPGRPRRHDRIRPAWRWAAAALLMFGLGIGIGRMRVTTKVDTEQIRAEIERSIRVGVLQTLREEIKQETARDLGTALSELKELTAKLAEAQWTTYSAEIEQGRRADREEILVRFSRFQNEITTRYLALRQDLETVAALTESEVRQARQGLMRLAAYTTRGTELQ